TAQIGLKWHENFRRLAQRFLAFHESCGRRSARKIAQMDLPVGQIGHCPMLGSPLDPQRQPEQEASLIIVTTENVSGHRTDRMLGQCFGIVVRSRGLGGNLMAGLRSIVGGEIHEYTQMLEEARRHALDRLAQNATAMGANAILMMRFDSAEIGQTMSEIVAYGTA